MGLRIVPVSYTHLDTGLSLYRSMGWLLLYRDPHGRDRSQSLGAYPGGREAVSYTHLDVYKRQPLRNHWSVVVRTMRSHLRDS